MRTRILLTIAATATILAGCSNEETNEAIDSWDGEILLNSGLAVQTRAETKETIKDGEKVYVWAEKVTTPPPSSFYISAWELTASSGALNPGSGNENKKYYPSDGNKLNFYAIHGNFGESPFSSNTDFPSESGITHTVLADQSDDNKANYTKSDLLYAIQKDVSKSNSAVELPFYHMLSKIAVVLKQGTGSPILDGATVTIESTQLKVTFKPSKNDTRTPGSNSISSTLELVESENNATPITIPTKTTTDFSATSPAPTYGEAIVVPQTVTKGANFIKVALANGGATFTYKIPNGGSDNDLTLESGKAYKYNITVNSSELTVTSSIENWDITPTTSTGEATMDDPDSGNAGSEGAGGGA